MRGSVAREIRRFAAATKLPYKLLKKQWYNETKNSRTLAPMKFINAEFRRKNQEKT